MAPSELLCRLVCRPSVAMILAATDRIVFELTKGAAPRYALVPMDSRMALMVTKLAISVTGKLYVQGETGTTPADSMAAMRNWT
jgi:hypothetical protein